jgi:hypothetical protein
MHNAILYSLQLSGYARTLVHFCIQRQRVARLPQARHMTVGDPRRQTPIAVASVLLLRPVVVVLVVHSARHLRESADSVHTTRPFRLNSFM